jgi:hypothetical protein
MIDQKIKVVLGVGVVEGRVIQENEKTILVKLPNGSVVKRHKDKHIVSEILDDNNK